MNPLRATKRGELFTQSIAKGRCALADEGSYFVATNPTPGTGIAGIAAADGYDATEALCVIRNANTAGDNSKRIVLDYIKLQVTVAGASGTNSSYATHLDTGNTRVASGGSTLTTVSPNMASTDSSNAAITFGAIVTNAASSSVRKLGSGLLRSVIHVVGDVTIFDFGGDPKPPAGLAVAGTAILQQVVPHAPVVLGPNDEFILTINAASQAVTGASYEVEIGYWER